MAKGSSSSVPPRETFSVFVDTSLGTHLVMPVSPEDTVGDLKGKISNEHAVCFPSIGDITVQSIKVRRKGSFYHLSESMLVRSAFDGIKRTWFLHIDVVSVCHQAGTTEHVTNQDAGQSQNHRLLDTEPNATDFGSGEVILQIVNFSSDGKDLISTDMNSVHEKQTLPETYQQMVSVNNKFSLPHAGISNDNFDNDIVNVGVSTHTNLSTKGMHDDLCMSPHDPEKRSDADLPELLEPVCEGNVAVGSDLEPKTNQMLDQGEDGREGDHCNVGVEANDGFVSIKKHKSRKRSNVSRTDPLLEKDGSFVEKKKHKKEHDDPSEDPLAKENNPVSAEKLCGTPHHNDCSPKNLTSNEKEKKKKNRKKKGASKFDDDNASAIPKTGTSDASLEKTGDVVSDAALFIDKSTRSADDGDSVEDLVNTESVEDPSGNIRRDLIKESDVTATIGEPVGHRNPAGDSEVPSKSNVRSSHRSRRGNSDKTEISQVNSKEAPDYQHRDPDKESKFGEAVVLENSAIEDSAVSSAPKETSSRHKRKKSSKAELTNHGSLDKEPVCSIMKGTTGENPLETLEDIHKQQGKESKWETFLGEGAPLESPADVNLAIPSNTIDRSSHHHKRKKVKAEVSCTSINHELDECKGRTTHDETVQNLAPGNHINAKSTGLPNDSSKKHDIAHHSIKKAAEENIEGLLGLTATPKGHAKAIESNDHMEPQKPDSDKVSFIEFFVPKASQLDPLAPSQELSSMETETRKSHKEKFKRKRKSNIHSEDSTYDSVNLQSLDTQNVPKNKPQDSEPPSHSLVDSAVQLKAKEPKAKKTYNENSERSTSDVHLGDTCPGLGAIENLRDNNMLEKKRHQVSMPKHEKSKHLKGKTSAVSERKHKSIPYGEGKNIKVSAEESQQPENFDASVRSSLGAEPITQNHSSACADVSIKETMADLAASSESTEENTPYQSKRYRVAVRKVPSKRFGKNMNNTGQEKTSLPTSGTIFSDALSRSSEDEFEIDKKKATSKVLSDNSSTSDDSDGDLEETQMNSLVKPRACMNSPGVDSVVYGKNDDGIDDIIMTQPSSVAKKSMLLDTILRSTSRYLSRKTKPTASQSELEDSESQPVEGVLETQPVSL